MGEKLGRREFVKAGVVAIAGAALSGSRLQLVRQAARSLKAKAIEAEDPDPEPARSRVEEAAEFEQICRQLSPDECAEMKELMATRLKLASRDKARRDLLWCGRYPIVQGSELFPEYEPGARGKSKAEIVSMLDDLGDEDLFAVNALVGCLACA